MELIIHCCLVQLPVYYVTFPLNTSVLPYINQGK